MNNSGKKIPVDMSRSEIEIALRREEKKNKRGDGRAISFERMLLAQARALLFPSFSLYKIKVKKAIFIRRVGAIVGVFASQFIFCPRSCRRTNAIYYRVTFATQTRALVRQKKKKRKCAS